MSYIVEQTESLLRVLEHVSPLSTHRLAGYAANAEFWASEICHCRELLDGYFGRYQRMKQGTEDYLREHPIDPRQFDSDTRTTRNTKDAEIRDLRRRLNETSNRFFSRLSETNLLSDKRIDEISRLLGEAIIGDESHSA